MRQSTDGNKQGKFYAGVACLDKDHQKIGNYRYCAVNGRRLEASEGWQSFEGSIGGTGSSAQQFPEETVYVRPMCLLNYNQGTGTTQVALIEFYDSSNKQLLQNSRFNQQIRHWSHDPSGQNSF